ncbi:MAG: two-component system, sensor histidine kinase ChiS [Thermoplasmata archaeon]|jgi:signal transduction histidine kinase|nr:two-component system, sensor histidine kinase ChiS [Thermoplasmata archaeon]
MRGQDTAAAQPPPGEAEGDAQRLGRLADAMARAIAGDFSSRVDVPASDASVVDRVLLLARFILDDLERAHKERSREVEKLREIDRMKSRFINTAAHELGTPLTPIRLQMHLLRSGAAGPTTEAQERALGILNRNLDRVVLLSGDLLSVSRMEAGELRLHKAPMDLATLVRDTYESFVGPAQERGVHLELVPGPPLWVDGDAARLGQVLDNMTTNALKFTPRGGRVRIGARRRGTEALVQVEDSGIGLSGDELARLFKPFAKLADQSPHGDPGTGLGLYISKGLVERHGGLMWIESPGRGQGATACFALPVAPEPAAEGTA